MRSAGSYVARPTAGAAPSPSAIRLNRCCTPSWRCPIRSRRRPLSQHCSSVLSPGISQKTPAATQVRLQTIGDGHIPRRPGWDCRWPSVPVRVGASGRAGRRDGGPIAHGTTLCRERAESLRMLAQVARAMASHLPASVPRAVLCPSTLGVARVERPVLAQQSPPATAHLFCPICIRPGDALRKCASR